MSARLDSAFGRAHTAMEQTPTADEVLAALGGQWLDLPWLNEVFDELNVRHFSGRLARPTFARASYEGKYALYVPQPYRILTFHPRLLEQDARWISDSILHEMIHMRLDDGKENTDKDHGKRFVMEANRIGRMLGLRGVAPGSDDAIEWPQAIRKRGFPEWRLPE